MRCCICLLEEEQFGALRCGHVFGVKCLEERFRSKSLCPTCRAPSGPDSVLRLYLHEEDAEEVEHDASSAEKNLFVQHAGEIKVQVDKLKQIADLLMTLGVDSSVADIEGAVGSSERAQLFFDELAIPALQEHFELWCERLLALRKHLKYSRRLEEVKVELEHYNRIAQEREKQIRVVVAAKHEFKHRLQDTLEQVKTLEESNRLWSEKYVRMKDKFNIQEHKRAAVHRIHAKKVSELECKLASQNLKLVKYKKQAVASKQAQSKMKRAIQEGYVNDPDESLEIIGDEDDIQERSPGKEDRRRRLHIPGSYPSSKPPSLLSATSVATSGISSVHDDEKAALHQLEANDNLMDDEILEAYTEEEYLRARDGNGDEHTTTPMNPSFQRSPLRPLHGHTFQEDASGAVKRALAVTSSRIPLGLASSSRLQLDRPQENLGDNVTHRGGAQVWRPRVWN